MIAPRPIMTNRQVVSVVIVMLCGVALWIIPAEVDDGQTSFASGAALLPDLAVSLILFFVLLDLVISFARRISMTKVLEADVVIKRAQILGLLTVVGAMTVYAIALLLLGYLVASGLLLIFLMFCTGGRNIALIVVISVMAVAVLYLGMRYGFGIHLPALPNFTELKG